MGSFIGHVVPGSFFLVGGLWWTWNIFKIYYKSKCKNGKPFHSLPWYPASFCKYFPFECAVKVGFIIMGMTMEVVAGSQKGFHGIMNNAQHMTMFASFGLTGVVDLLKYYSKFPPDDIDRFSTVLAYAIEGFLFQNHLHGLKPMEIQVHMLLFYLIIGCTVSALLEMVYQNSVICSFSKAYFVILQATWFYQIGFTLYHPFGMRSWDLEDHGQMAYVSLIFTFHIGVVFFLMLLLGGCVWGHMKRTRQLPDINYDIVPSESMLTSTALKANGHPQRNDKLLEFDNELI